MKRSRSAQAAKKKQSNWSGAGVGAGQTAKEMWLKIKRLKKQEKENAADKSHRQN